MLVIGVWLDHQEATRAEKQLTICSEVKTSLEDGLMGGCYYLDVC